MQVGVAHCCVLGAPATVAKRFGRFGGRLPASASAPRSGHEGHEGEEPPPDRGGDVFLGLPFAHERRFVRSRL